MRGWVRVPPPPPINGNWLRLSIIIIIIYYLLLRYHSFLIHLNFTDHYDVICIAHGTIFNVILIVVYFEIAYMSL